ncbi:MAG TPA: hypothetical protein VG317_16890 [Pseudonocardiaceae bacterium]|jgi:hypothetical protein|nr:hypothetical protein [Pseudonocardiaceae bacterium]
MGLHRLVGRLAAGLAGVALLAGASAWVTPGLAAAAVTNGHGYSVPAQPYLHNPDPTDWLGSYVVNGNQVWCIDFALKAPDANEPYQPDGALTTKWGTPVDPTTAAEISYLLLRYGNTTSPDVAAALAHLLHSWTAAPQNPSQLSPNNTYLTVAYDAPTHLRELPAGAQAQVQALQADAAANHGPWTAALSTPSGKQTIGTKANWTVQVHNAAGKEVPGVPVTLTATDATLSGGKNTTVLSTPADGPLTVAVTPTGPNPKVVASLASPAAQPKVLNPVAINTQKVVTTGGQQQITTTGGTTAQTAPGRVTVSKIDASTKSPIAGASLELTGGDRTSSAVQQDGSPVQGTDGKPLVLHTGSDGTATFVNLKTPQDVCVIETAPAAGYDQSFNPTSPPTACGTVTPGGTLTLSLTNVANKVPVAIPAGGGPAAIATTSAVINQVDPGTMMGLGLLLIVVAGAGSWLASRALRR